MQEPMSLKNKTITGVFWSFFDLLANQGLQLIVLLILARALMPEDFGIISMITIFIAISQLFIDGGLSNALIREKEVSQEDYSTIFYINLFIAIMMYAILFFSASIISVFFDEPKLVTIIRVLSLTLIINSFGFIQRIILIKKVDFKTQTGISLTASILSGIISIVFAYLGYGVWSLVLRTLSMQFLQSLALCLYNKWIPSIVFRINSLKRLFAFSWKLLVSGLINTLYENLYYIIIGSSFSALELGYYTNASKLRDTVSQSITASVQRVSYPVLSSIQDEDSKLKLSYKKIIKNSVYITFPVMIGLSAVATPLISLLYGYKWVDSISYFQVLCFAGMLFPLHAINLNILQVKGRSDLFLGLEVVKMVMTSAAVSFVLLFKLGIMGLLWVAVIISFIAFFINSYFSAKLLLYSTKEQIKDITPIFIVSILMGAAVYLSGLVLPDNNVIKLISQFFIACTIYLLLSKIAKIEELNTVKDFLVTIIGKTRYGNRVQDRHF